MKVGEGGREVVHALVEPKPHTQFGEGGREVDEGLVEFVAKGDFSKGNAQSG